RPFEAALRQAEAALGQRQAEVQQAQANLERDQAQLDNAKVQERRYRDLVDRELIAREQYDQLRTNWAALEATVAADRAAVENARSEEHTSELQSRSDLVCRLLLEKKKKTQTKLKVDTEQLS